MMRSVFLLFIITSLSLWTGCSDSAPEQTDATPKALPKAPLPPQNHFQITDIDKRSTTISFEKNKLRVAKVMQPLILIHLFASWSPPSCGMIPYLDALQKSYPKALFVIGVMVNSTQDSKRLRIFMKTHHASYFISNASDNDKLGERLAALLKLGTNYPVPLTLLFKNGEYTMHYVGATPIEMIKADIEQLRRK